MKYLDNNGLSYLWQKIKAVISKTTGIPTNGIIEYEGDAIPEGYVEVEGDNVYSTTEQVVGTYLGKTLYRKCILGTMANTPNTWVAVNHNVANVELMFIKEFYYAYNGKWYNAPNDIIIEIGAGENSVDYYFTNPAINGVDIRITIEYTKTTD